MTDLARVIGPECARPVIGIRPGEKLHEVMVPVDDGRMCLEFGDHFILKPNFAWWGDDWHSGKGGTACPDGFYYGSDNNTEWVDDTLLGEMISHLELPEAKEWAIERGLA